MFDYNDHQTGNDQDIYFCFSINSSCRRSIFYIILHFTEVQIPWNRRLKAPCSRVLLVQSQRRADTVLHTTSVVSSYCMSHPWIGWPVACCAVYLRVFVGQRDVSRALAVFGPDGLVGSELKQLQGGLSSAVLHCHGQGLKDDKVT